MRTPTEQHRGLSQKSHIRLQSAMEYLMTYGWALLIIAVVLGALFGLGVFNAANLAPKAQPGSCQVYRPNGPGTTSFINLEGACNNALPKYVAKFDGTGYVSGPSSAVNTASGGYNTVSFWMDWNGNTPEMPFRFSAYDLYLYNGCFGFNTGNGDIYGTSLPSANQWIYIAAVFYNGAYTGHNQLYINGQPAAMSQCMGSANSGTATTNFNVSGWGSHEYFLEGSVSNVQIYNTSLDANDINTLYYEGIGGSPIALPWLAGWWPLNGDANDYSGNNNNGVPTNVIYTTGWTSAYSAP